MYGSISPKLDFGKNQDWMKVIQCCIMIAWTYLAFVNPLIFCSKPDKVSDKNT